MLKSCLEGCDAISSPFSFNKRYVIQLTLRAFPTHIIPLVHSRNKMNQFLFYFSYSVDKMITNLFSISLRSQNNLFFRIRTLNTQNLKRNMFFIILCFSTIRNAHANTEEFSFADCIAINEVTDTPFEINNNN